MRMVLDFYMGVFESESRPHHDVDICLWIMILKWQEWHDTYWLSYYGLIYA